MKQSKPHEVAWVESILYDFLEKVTPQLASLPSGEVKRELVELILNINSCLEIIDRDFN